MVHHLPTILTVCCTCANEKKTSSAYQQRKIHQQNDSTQKLTSIIMEPLMETTVSFCGKGYQENAIGIANQLVPVSGWFGERANLSLFDSRYIVTQD